VKFLLATPGLVVPSTSVGLGMMVTCAAAVSAPTESSRGDDSESLSILSPASSINSDTSVIYTKVSMSASGI